MTDPQRRPELARQLTLEPIGYVRCALATKVEAARQPRARASAGAEGRIELLPARNFEHALCDLPEWQYIWVVYWFDRNDGTHRGNPVKSDVRAPVSPTHST